MKRILSKAVSPYATVPLAAILGTVAMRNYLQARRMHGALQEQSKVLTHQMLTNQYYRNVLRQMMGR